MRLSVKDSGAGISDENMKKLFGQYVQFNTAKLQQGKGSGLGLWISKRIIELHGGVIGAHSDGEGCGTTFFFELPLYDPRQESEAAVLKDIEQGVLNDQNPAVNDKVRRNSLLDSAWETILKIIVNNKTEDLSPRIIDKTVVTRTLPPLVIRGSVKKVQPITEDLLDLSASPFSKETSCWESGLNVLVVDDSALNLKMMTRLLVGSGHQVKQLSDGQQFLQMVEDQFSRTEQKSNKSNFDIENLSQFHVVLMDDNMPGLSGPEATRRAKALGYKGLVVGVTGNAFEDQVQNYLACGANAVLQKPLDLKLIRKKLDELMK